MKTFQLKQADFKRPLFFQARTLQEAQAKILKESGNTIIQCPNPKGAELMNAPEGILLLTEPHLKKDPGHKPVRYQTTWGSKTRIGLLACFQRIINEYE